MCVCGGGGTGSVLSRLDRRGCRKMVSSFHQDWVALVQAPADPQSQLLRNRDYVGCGKCCCEHHIRHSRHIHTTATPVSAWVWLWWLFVFLFFSPESHFPVILASSSDIWKTRQKPDLGFLFSHFYSAGRLGLVSIVWGFCMCNLLSGALVRKGKQPVLQGQISLDWRSIKGKNHLIRGKPFNAQQPDIPGQCLTHLGAGTQRRWELATWQCLWQGQMKYYRIKCCLHIQSGYYFRCSSFTDYYDLFQELLERK